MHSNLGDPPGGGQDGVPETVQVTCHNSIHKAKMSLSVDGAGESWQDALNQKGDWDSYKRNYYAKYGKYPLGAKNLGQFTARYAKKMERQAQRDATGQGYRDWKAMGWGAEAPPASVAFSDAQMLSRGKYRRRRPVRRRRVYRKRGAYGTRKFASDMNNIGRAFGNLGRRFTKKETPQ